jgi:hypothetical protein
VRPLVTAKEHWMSLIFLLSLMQTALAEEVAPVLAVAEDEDDFFSTPAPTEQRGANAGVPNSDAFKEEEGFDIPITKSEEELAAEAKLKAAVAAEREAEKAKSTAMPVKLDGATVLADNWAPVIVVADRAAVVVEMPVLYAASKKDFDGKAYWLVAEVFADGKKVAESRANVTAEAVATTGPSVHFFRLFAPVGAASGVLEVKVSKAPASGKSELLFTRSVKYQTQG